MDRVAVASAPGLPRSWRQLLLLLLVAGAAWAWTVDRAVGMGDMPGTMGRDAAAFIVMWTLMMTAMMLPSAAPFTAMYARTIVLNQLPRLLLFAGGYLLVWGAAGLPALGLAWSADQIVNAAPAVGTVAAVTIFVACGVYQLTPLKYRCLALCRSPLAQIFHVTSFQGALRDLRAGAHNGFFCLSCCWPLMVLLVAFGFMNMWAMIGLAAVVAIEKHWPHGEAFGKAIAMVAFGLAVAVVWVPELAPGLDAGGSMMAMETP